MLDQVLQFLLSAGRPRICVVGDVMLDIYLWGDVSRVSQEGPVPVVRVEKKEHRTGGAANVAAMLAALGADVATVGLIGDDPPGQELGKALARTGVDTAGLVTSAERPTATKTRCLGYVQSAGRALQQIVRIDDEVTTPLSGPEGARVRAAVNTAAKAAELIVLQDMGKGLLDAGLIRHIIDRAAQAGKPVLVDPELTDDYSPYVGAACVVPNRFEAQMATGIELHGPDECERAARQLLDSLSLEAAVIKLDRDGIYYATADGKSRRMSTHALGVADITGAGDMVTAALAFARASGADYGTAVALANLAAGIEVGLHGVTPVSRRRLVEVARAEAEPIARKIVPRADVAELVAELQQSGKKVAFTNGCFDLLHLGHVQLLAHARAQGDVLVVGLNSDASARELKGPGRPVNSEDVRARVLASMEDVDHVVLFDEESVLSLVKEIRPDVLVKGGDYTMESVVGHELVQSYGGRVELAPEMKGYSTTDIISRIAGNDDGSDRGDSA